MKSNVRIGGAMVVGVLIILGALYMSTNTHSQSAKNSGNIFTQKSLRESIDVTDVNHDGIPDWKETLEKSAYEAITAPSSTSPYTFNTESYTAPTTLTGKFSEAFLQDYLEGKMKGQDFSDPTAFTNTAVAAIRASTQSKKHTRTELTIVATSEDAIRMYGNEVAEIMKKYSINNESEMVILQRAIETHNPSVLDNIKPIQTAYEHIIADSLIMNVPDKLAVTHIELLNALEAILTDVRAMQLSFTDPLYALARVNTYESDARALYTSLKKIADVLNEQNITYTQTEPGAFFYMFDAV